MTKAGSKRNIPRMVRSHDVTLDAEYADWIRDIKRRYRSAQVKAAVKVNSEQLLFNWELGRDLVVRKAEERWGSGVVEQVSLDLQSEFPDAKGFSTRNLWYMKRWYQFYATGDMQEKLHQLGAEMASMSAVQLAQVANAPHSEFLHQPGAESEAMLFPQIFAYVPWRHHVEIITHCKSVEEAAFYIERTVQEGWSRSALQNAIDGNLYGESGIAQTNFTETLPSVQSRLAQAIAKDTYDLGFVTLPKAYDEHDLEVALEQNITRFLLELGTGFAFMGRQKEIIVSGKPRRIDMLFYHIRLRCYVVLEVKVTDFDPAYMGQLGTYVVAVNHQLKTDEDNPTIGLLVCKSLDKVEAQYALESTSQPIGVSGYELSKLIPEDFKGSLPTIEEIEAELADPEGEQDA